MSGRLAATRLATLARRTPVHTPRLYTTHALPAGGLLRNEAGLRLIKRRPWPLGSYALHNVPATRSISFARVIPKLVGKFATAGAVTGGAVIAGVSYIQYQAGRTYIFFRLQVSILTYSRGRIVCARPLPPDKRQRDRVRWRRSWHGRGSLRPARKRMEPDKGRPGEGGIPRLAAEPPREE